MTLTEALDWAHTLDEWHGEHHPRGAPGYKAMRNAHRSGRLVAGALFARGRAHHGLHEVFTVQAYPDPLYICVGQHDGAPRWRQVGTYAYDYLWWRPLTAPRRGDRGYHKHLPDLHRLYQATLQGRRLVDTAVQALDHFFLRPGQGVHVLYAPVNLQRYDEGAAC